MTQPVPAQNTRKIRLKTVNLTEQVSLKRLTCSIAFVSSTGFQAEQSNFGTKNWFGSCTCEFFRKKNTKIFFETDREA